MQPLKDDDAPPPSERELAGLLKELERVRAENDALARRIGARAAAVRSAPRLVASPDEGPRGGYRGPDRAARLARLLPEARSALASERMDQAILQRMLEAPRASVGQKGPWIALVTLVAVAGGVALVADNFGVFLAIVVVGGLFIGIVWFISSLPTHRDAPPPRGTLPPPGV